MSGQNIYYTDMVAAAKAGGVPVRENAITDGWQERARSSGGYPEPPKGVWWHHTASDTTPENDLTYMIDTCDDAPVGSWLVDREGWAYPIAAGASNCAGKGGPATFSRGVVPQDQGNTGGWQIEIANNGLGEPYSEAQLNTVFALSNVLNALAGNQATDVITHALGAGDGYTDRKIDPATAAAVQGPWDPRSTNSSGTWSLADLRAECARRAGTSPGPNPPPLEDDDIMLRAAKNKDTGNTYLLGDGVKAQTMDGLAVKERDLRIAGGAVDVATLKIVYTWGQVTAISGNDCKTYVGKW